MGDVRIGLVGLDTSHAVAFAKLLNDPREPHHVAGGRITVAFAGGSKDFELSQSHLAQGTREMTEDFGVKLVDSPKRVAEECDLVFITSLDGRKHLPQFREILPFKRPTFIDKPLACNLTDAQEIYRLARVAEVPVLSSSALRFADPFVAVMAAGPATRGCDVYGPLPIEATQYGWFWYGVHSVELLVAAMGVGCESVLCQATESGDVLTAIWNDGRLASIHGLRAGHGQFGVTIHRETKATTVDLTDSERPVYAGLLDAIMSTLPHGQVPVSPQETLEVMRILHAANRARETAEQTAV